MKKYIAICLLLVSFLYTPAEAQKSKKKKEEKKETGSSAAKNWGIGLRIGDPLGLTLKKYFGSKFAIEFNLGKTFFLGSGYDRYYRHDSHLKYRGPYYNNVVPYPGNPYPGYPYYYDGLYYSSPRAVSMQLHFLGHKNIASVNGLQLYYGAGPQLRILTYDYGYYYNTNIGRMYYSDSYRQMGIGIDLKMGTEYTFSSVPISLFADLNLYLEIAEIPFWLGVQGGIGGRFNF